VVKHEVQDAVVLDVPDGRWRADLCGDWVLDGRAVGPLDHSRAFLVHLQPIVGTIDSDRSEPSNRASRR
jgi:hypothetical protein